MQSKIWLSSPHMGGAEKDYVNEAFDTNWIAPLGPHVNAFEHDLAGYTKVKHAAALSSGTGALHLALIILGVQPGDEVICQSLTFSASANPIAYLGAHPIFVDSERETWNICPDLLLKAIKDRIAKGKKPKAIIPVHLYGMPAQMDRIMAIANEYEIPVIEDAAESLGSQLNGKAMGSYGTMSIISFNGNKIITTSGGGALLSNDEVYILKARFLATQARDQAAHYEHTQIGYNYRMSNVCAAIGRGQMEVLEERVAQRRANFEFYYNALSHNEGVSFNKEPHGYYSNRWLSTLLVDPSKSNGIDRTHIAAELLKDNIESRPLWKPMHLQPVFKDAICYLNGVSEDLFSKGLCLPSGSNLSNYDRQRVVENVSNTLLSTKVTQLNL